MRAARRIHQGARRGVTLIELLVAMVILGFALAFVLPEVGLWLRGLEVRNAAESVRTGIERARMEALRRNTTMTFWLVSDTNKVLTNSCALSNSGPSWVVSGASPAGKCGATPSQTDDPMLVDGWSSSDGSRGVQMSGLDGTGAGAASVTFNSLGQVLATGAQLMRVDISSTSGASGVRSLRVQIDAGGSPRMCDPSVSGTDPRKC